MDYDSITLAGLEGGDYEVAFETYQIPDYVLEKVPAHYRPSITGAVYEIIDGELGEVWLTNSSRPYNLSTWYYTPEFWREEDGAAEA